ncbi:unnamed protein product, partial [Alternaria alternata]
MHSSTLYDAISYTWRDLNKTKRLIVNGEWLACPAAVQNIVLDRASYSCERYIWIDFVCINQDDLDERNQQVKLMRAIYATADRVIVWLGNASGAELALNLLYELRDLVLRTPESPTLDEIQFSPRQHLRSDQWIALSKLLNHAYWTRTWIIQEIAAAQRVHVMYSRRYLQWEYLAAFAMTFYTPDRENFTHFREMIATGLPLSSGISQIMYLATIRLQIQEGEALKLEQMIEKFHSCRASDPRDRIYGIQGITTANEAAQLLPDYRKSVEEVYMGTTLYLMELEYPFYPLHFAGVGNLGRIPTLPSWVPDFSSGRHHATLGHWANDSEATYFASGHEFSKRYSLHSIENRLSVRGYLIDKIAQVNTVHLRRPPDQSTADYPYGTLAIDLANWEHEARIMIPRVPDPYPMQINKSAFQSRTEAFARTLIADLGTKPTHHRPASAAHFESFRAHEQLGKSFEHAARLLRGASEPQTGEIAAAMSFFDRLSRISRTAVPTDRELSSLLADIGVRNDLSPVVITGLLQLQVEVQRWLGDALLWKYRMGQACIGRSFAITEKGYMGLVPEGTVAGDDLVVFIGMQTPVVVRRDGAQSPVRMRAQLIGE